MVEVELEVERDHSQKALGLFDRGGRKHTDVVVDITGNDNNLVFDYDILVSNYHPQ